MSSVYSRYGANYQSVSFNFEAKSLTEVGFRRDHEASIPVNKRDEWFQLIKTVEVTAEAEGGVQFEVEQQLLDRLEERAQAAVDSLPLGGVAIIENERGGLDQPKPRQSMGNVVVEGENRFHFTYRIEPPLRIGLYRRRKESGAF